jgi:beta-galactosidase/beta-glucuronidase
MAPFAPFLLSILLLLSGVCKSQISKQFLHDNWNLRQASSVNWISAKVPGNIHQTLLDGKKIKNPFYANNNAQLEWIEKEDWEYGLYFDVADNINNRKSIKLIFEGIDTYAEIKLNGKSILNTDNMFRKYECDVTTILKKNGNNLTVTINSATTFAQKLEQESSIKLPTDYRAFLRKAAFGFGWDFAPRIVTAGIYKPVYLQVGNEQINLLPVKPFAKFDTAAVAFIRNGKKIFAKGANFIPPNSMNFNVTHAYYDSLMVWCKNANINMLRVWGGGTYPDDYFYTACDKNKIMVWQDFMQANAMPPIDNYISRRSEAASKQACYTSMHCAMVR